jgi:N-acetylglucosamine transport system permease protein
MRRQGERLFIVSFLAPAVIIYTVFLVWPLLQAFVISLYRWRGVSAHRTFVGFGNFTDLAADTAFRKALTNNLELLVVGGLIVLVLAIAVAHGLQGTNRLSRNLRGLVLVPQILSLVVVAILWQNLFDPQVGLVNAGLKAIHEDRFIHAWLGEPGTALTCVGIAFAWYAVGFYVMLFSAALRNIPAEVVEASELDGAYGLRRFFSVTWPMLWSVKRVAVVHLTILVMNVFVLVLLMTRGGPDRASEVMLTYLYENAFTDFQFGYATAIAVVNFIVVMILSAAILFIFRRNPEVSKA